jgi:hypothetical protein
MGWIGILVLVAIVVVIFLLRAVRDRERDDAFLEAAERLGLTSIMGDPPRVPKGGFPEIMRKVPMPHKDYFPSPGPMVRGAFGGWDVVVWSYSFNSNPADSHTGTGYRRTISAAAASNPSKQLRNFRLDVREGTFENAGPDKLGDAAMEKLTKIHLGGWTVQSDGQWLLMDSPYEIPPSSLEGVLRLLTEFADAIKKS